MTNLPPDAKAAIRDYVLGKLVAEGTLRDDESFWETRAVDSLGIVRLVHFLQKTFGIEIPGRDVTTVAFASIDAVHAYVAAKLAAKGGSTPT